MVSTPDTYGNWAEEPVYFVYKAFNISLIRNGCITYKPILIKWGGKKFYIRMLNKYCMNFEIDIRY